MGGAPDRVYYVALAYEPSRPFAEVRFTRRFLGLAAPVIECVSISDDREGNDWIVLIRRELGDDEMLEYGRPDPPADIATFDRVMATIPLKYRRLVTYSTDSPPPPPDRSVRRIELDSWTNMWFGLSVSQTLGEYQSRGPAYYGINTTELKRELAAYTPDEVIEATARLAAMPGIDLAPLRQVIEDERFDAELAARIREVIGTGEGQGESERNESESEVVPERVVTCACGRQTDPDTSEFCLVCGSALSGD